ncbi:MAG: type IV secretory system conjugative DNA transfer family protein [Gammaproteobacteria bacterium]|nr:type IV secretory system conjugative DNA transfer family protein [Gammaproteobacteria bacterium]
MSKLIAGTFTGLFKAGKWLYGQQRLSKETGARFATPSEIKALTRSSNTGVLIDGRNKRLSNIDSFQAVGIFSPPGRGKTSGYIIPNILDKARQNCSMLVSDPSGEIFEHTSGYLKSRGFDIHVLCPSEVEYSSQFNPFDGLDHRHIDEIGMLCQSIILSKYGGDKEQIWNDGALDIQETLAKCLAYSRPDMLNLPNLNYLIQRFGADGRSLDDWVAENSTNPNIPTDTTVVDAWKSLISQQEKMLSSFATIARTSLKPFNNRQVQELFFGNDIDFSRFRKRKTIVFIKLKENKMQYYQFLIDLFYTKFFSAMTSAIPSRRELDVYCFLDEFGHAYVHNFPTIINNIRKYRVSLSLVFQSVSQITNKYGQEGGKTIKSAISNYLVFAGADMETAREQSQKIGKRVIQQKASFDDHVDKYNQLDLMPPESIRTLDANKLLFLSGNHHPFVTEFTPYYERSSPYRSASKKKAFSLPHRGSRSANRLVI